MKALNKAMSPVSKLADHIERTGLEIPSLADEFRYKSLPICVVDAVFSINAHSTSTQNVVKNLCDHTGWTRLAPSREGRGKGERGIRDLIAVFAKVGGVEEMADQVFKNRQRPFPRSGILKADVVLRFCHALTEAGINNFTDLDQDRRELAEAMILSLPGQSSGIAFDYFMMLAGDDNLIKPDRMVLRYVRDALAMEKITGPRQAAVLVRLTSKELCRRGFNSNMTPLNLDYAIWNYQSEAGDRG